MDCDSTVWTITVGGLRHVLTTLDGDPVTHVFWRAGHWRHTVGGSDALFSTSESARAWAEGGGGPIEQTDCDNLSGLASSEWWALDWLDPCDSGEPNTDNDEGKL